MNSAIIISIISIGISALSFIQSRKAYDNFAKNEFVKEQIKVVINLVTYLNSESFVIGLMSYSEKGNSGIEFRTNIFEVSKIDLSKYLDDLLEVPICFHRSCNQILNIKHFINNPFLPKSIADELEKFYSRSHIDLTYKQVEGEKLVVLKTNCFEDSEFNQRTDSEVKLYQPHCFALLNMENWIVCNQFLEDSIVKWLTSYNVEQINIRKDFKYV